MARPLKEDLTGKRFGRLFVVRRSGSRSGQAFWWCLCDCGIEGPQSGSHLRGGHTKSCGCWRREFPKVTKTTHGHRRSRIYGVWNGMISRCHNPNQAHYPRYGGRGIAVCQAWRDSFMSFYQHVGEPPQDGQRWTLDRINNDGNYEPGNVRWATAKEQRMNQRVKKSS